MLDLLSVAILFVFGTILGSFLNALAFRYQSGKSMWGRSACMTCNTTLEAVDLVPILSYVYLKGRCRRCKANIAMQYPIVEIIAGILTVLSYSANASTIPFLLTLAFFQLLLFISVYDLKHTIIPDLFAYAAAATALLFVWVSSGMSANPLSMDPYALLAGPLLALPLWAIWFFSKGKAMGLGDAKLYLGVGWFLGISAGFAAFIISFWIGAIVGVFLMLASRTSKRQFKMKSEIPFGPFIVFSTAVVYFAHIDFYTLATFFG